MPAASASISASRRRSCCSARQPPGRAARVDARAEQRLVRVDVADARDPALVEQQRLDRRAAAPRERAQVLGGEAPRRTARGRGARRRTPPAPRAERAARRCRSAADRRSPGARSPRAAARARLRERARARRAACARACAPARGRDRRAPRPSCAGAGRGDVVVEAPQQVLAAPASCSTRRPSSARSSSAGASGRDQRGSRISTLEQAPALHERRQLAPDRLDLGQLGHAAPSL